MNAESKNKSERELFFGGLRIEDHFDRTPETPMKSSGFECLRDLRLSEEEFEAAKRAEIDECPY